MSETGDQVVTRVAAWAEARPDIAALVQIGSRVQPGGAADSWSDYDFQLITRRPAAYADPAVLTPIGDVWLASAQPVFGGATKLTVILADAVEMDFVVLPHWQLRVALGALRFPAAESLWPPPLRHGVRDLRIVACPGWRVIKGGPAWEARYRRLGTAVPWPPLDEPRFHALCAEFWAALVWVTKKIERGELRAAQREIHRVLLEKTWLLLENETRARGATARPEARRAETWLDPRRLAQTAIGTAPDAAGLRRSTAAIAELFADLARHQAGAHGWAHREPSALLDWFRARSRP